MAQFIIKVPELRWSEKQVEAESMEEAFKKVAAGEGKEIDCTPADPFPPDVSTWEGRAAGADSPQATWTGGDLTFL